MKVVNPMFKIVAGLVVGAAMAFVPVAATHAAASATVFVSPASNTYTKGSTFSVAIYEDSHDNDADSASANLSYDAGKLEAQGISGGDFTTCVTGPTAGGGSISTGECTVLGGKKRGQQRLATVTFKAVAEGTASLNFTGAKVVNGGTDLPVTTVNGSFTVAAPAQGGRGAGSANNTMATTGSTGATSPVANNSAANDATVDNKGEVKSDTNATSDKKVENKATDNTNTGSKNTAAVKEGRNWWPMAVILLIAATAAAYAYRNRNVSTTKEEVAAPNKAAKKPVAAAPVQAVAAAPVAAKLAGAEKKANKSKQGAKKSGNRRPSDKRK